MRYLLCYKHNPRTTDVERAHPNCDAIVKQNWPAAQVRMSTDHRPMLQQAVSFDHRMLRHLRTVAQGGDGVLFPPGDNPRVAINSRVIADPDVVFVVTLQPRAIEDFRPMLNKRQPSSRVMRSVCAPVMAASRSLVARKVSWASSHA